jgi:hypothetical protein
LQIKNVKKVLVVRWNCCGALFGKTNSLSPVEDGSLEAEIEFKEQSVDGGRVAKNKTLF